MFPSSFGLFVCPRDVMRYYQWQVSGVDELVSASRSLAFLWPAFSIRSFKTQAFRFGGLQDLERWVFTLVRFRASGRWVKDDGTRIFLCCLLCTRDRA